MWTRGSTGLALSRHDSIEGSNLLVERAVRSRAHVVWEGGRTSILEGLMFRAADLNLREQAVEQLVAGTTQEVCPAHPAFL